MIQPKISDILLLRFPDYCLTHVLSSLAEVSQDHRLEAKLASQVNNYIPVSKQDFKQFIDNWKGEDISAFRGNVWSWNNDYKLNYIYTIESQRIVAKITTNKDSSQYFLALNG